MHCVFEETFVTLLSEKTLFIPTATKVEECLELRMLVDVLVGAEPSGKVDTNKRKEARTLEQNGS